MVKYAINSLDIHFILGKINECESASDSLITCFLNAYEKKGQIMKEYIELNKEGEEESD